MPLPASVRDGIYHLTLPLTNLIFGTSSLFYAPPNLLYSTEALQKSEEESQVLKMFILKAIWNHGLKMKDEKEEEEAWSMETRDGSEGADDRDWQSGDEDKGEEWESEDDEVLEKVQMA